MILPDACARNVWLRSIARYPFEVLSRYLNTVPSQVWLMGYRLMHWTLFVYTVCMGQ